MFTTTIEIIEVVTQKSDGSEYNIIQTECWFTALQFAKDALQSDPEMKCEMRSWEVEIQRNK